MDGVQLTPPLRSSYVHTAKYQLVVTMRGLRLVESAWIHKEMRAVVDSVSIAAHCSECCRGCSGSEGQLVMVADEPKTHCMVEKRGVLHQNSPVDVSIRDDAI